jgi:hypothetical protein
MAPIPKDPTGKRRWCHTCNKFRLLRFFSSDRNAYCHAHLKAYRRTQGQEWRNSNPGEVADYARKRYWADPEEARKKGRKKASRWRARNRKRSNAYHAGWRARNPESVKATQYRFSKKLSASGGYKRKYRKWRAADPARARRVWRAQYKKKYAKNPLYFYFRWLNRKAKKVNAAGTCTQEELDATFRRFRGICLYCRKPAVEHDHIVPLDRGGTNFSWNIGPACRSCNAEKGAQHPLVFIQAKQLRRSALQYVRLAVQFHTALERQNGHEHGHRCSDLP